MRARALLGLSGALAVLAAPLQAAPRADLLGAFVWRHDDPDFGGLSSLELAADGLGFLTASDRGRLFTGQFERDATGRVIGARIERSFPLRDPEGAPLDDSDADSEGLAVLPDETIVVSFEEDHRLSFQPRPDAPARIRPAPALSLDWWENQGMEALAAAPDGTLWALAEGAVGGVHAVLRLAEGAWQTPLALPAEGGWHPVGADFGPDGRLYLLERDFWPFIGFMTRVLRFDLSDAGLSPATVLFETRAGAFDNLEGLAAWRDSTGAIRLTLVSDDNFLPVQKTEIVDLRITE
ncbi:esterase-like activity of phytase family protein [Defluviimonas sp. WL0075]|uniref:Esterase-like activity of phytase family protein n=1 Tax=Albidovulum sediminicola TaxID=2984331 RepID=A0ABT2YWE7_9RHOB|nr:esterase-like activity of phytase family protein [Defluviimonas sp. WL0075]MCV2863203.1 esterase-like activity of phytase family protein [Defluviimonas sp. WL0075]